ncbi:hypothetical protein [Paenibacillus sp. NAIST15-1]|uniref:hypothetical protein n=1 Tax=Paenibacillus sp. NAIST15-1 TaxID=1605994 RepID=UPI000868BE50|nr:hypothetical protein [Paenibacillus sp. NAIST15-1]GAV16100.1 hypothetical protein PBN151_6085 [Paenibacillus sp. NAIST15-1]
METVQDIMTSELLETSTENEMIEVLDFIRMHGVPLTAYQAQALFQLQEAGLSDLAVHIGSVRSQMTPVKRYYDMTNKLTLADRIKGNAKLGQLLKANANPANAAGVPMGIKDGVK